MSFGAPLWLLALVAVAGAAVLLRPRGAVDRAAWLAWGLRIAAAAALVLALAQPRTGDGDDRPTVLVLDRSESVTADPATAARQRAWVRAAIDEHRCADPCRVVAFAGTASFAGVAGDDAQLPAASALDSGATDLAAALRLTTGALPDGGRAVVLSDGFDTGAANGTLAAAAAQAREAGVQVDAVTLGGGAAGARDAAVTRLTAPSPLHAGDRLTLQATVRSTVAGAAAITLTRDGASLGQERVRLRAGDNPLLLTYRAPEQGWHAYRMTVVLEGDEDPVNDALDATTAIGPPPRALVVEGTAGVAGTLPSALAADGVEVETTSVAAFDGDATSALDGADAVVLADVPARALDERTVTTLRTAVRDDGVGLLVLGGAHSLSLGGYAGTGLDALLPVQSLTPGGVRRRRFALQLVLDRSSSMNDLAGGLDPKIAMARTAARTAVALAARDGDELGVVAFDAVARDVVPLQRVTDASAGAIDELVSRLDADGGTNVARGLARGIAQLEGSAATVRHMILLSDGVSERADYDPLLARLRRARITLSTVALGQDADVALMRRLASAGGGRFYAVPDARALPSVFARETRRAAPSVAVQAALPVTAAAASPLVASLDGETPPPVAGTVVTRLRDGATAPLTATVNGETTPLLAHWQQGLGRVVVWAPGAGSWGGDWLAAHPQVVTDGLRWSERAVATPALQPSLSAGDPATVVVDPLATAGTPFDLGRVAGTVETPDGTRAPLTFDQVAPSRYAARLPGGAAASRGADGSGGAGGRGVGGSGGAGGPGGAGRLVPGVYGIGVDASEGQQAAPAGAQALLAVPYPAEHRPQPASASALPQLAAATGGVVLDPADPSAALAPGDEGALWQFAAIAAVALLIAAVAVERLARPRAAAPRAA